MRINMGGTGERSGVVQKKNVVIGPLKKESVFIDRSGNSINPRTKQLLNRNTDKE